MSRQREAATCAYACASYRDSRLSPWFIEMRNYPAEVHFHKGATTTLRVHIRTGRPQRSPGCQYTCMLTKVQARFRPAYRQQGITTVTHAPPPSFYSTFNRPAFSALSGMAGVKMQSPILCGRGQKAARRVYIYATGGGHIYHRLTGKIFMHDKGPPSSSSPTSTSTSTSASRR